MDRLSISRTSAFACICTLILLLFHLTMLPGCKQKAEDPNQPDQTQQEADPDPTDVAPPSADAGGQATPGEPAVTLEATPDTPPEEPPVTDEQVAGSPEDAAPEGPGEFELEVVSAFDLPNQIGDYFTRGQYATLQQEPDDQVKAYPDFESNTPLYGSILIGAEPGVADTGVRYHFAIDESRGPDRGYDWLYFDNDCDGDLSDEMSLRPMSNPPNGAMMAQSSNMTQVCFDYLSIKTVPGGDSKHNSEVMPRLLMFSEGPQYLFFVPTQARQGRITIAGRKFDACMGLGPRLTGGFDHPSTILYLLDARNQSPLTSTWAGIEQLMLMRKVGERLYRLSSTPQGDRLFVTPYDGPLGTLEIGAGDRSIEKISAQGGLQSEQIAVPFTCDSGKPSCRLPVGDYLPGYTTITYGDLHISLSQNYHSDGKPRDMEDRTWVYGIEIREDKPFVLDFSNEPKVIFALPAKDHRIRRGEELSVEAVLTDPELDVMIRRLSDLKSGNLNTSLDPKVTITRADGQVVAEGTMPFG